VEKVNILTNCHESIRKGYLTYHFEGVIGDYVQEWTDLDVPYETLRNIAEHLAKWTFAMKDHIVFILRDGKEMTMVKCEDTYCDNNSNGVCSLEEILLKENEHDTFDYLECKNADYSGW
jgi:hypothetical protein